MKCPFTAFGHPSIMATHRTTIAITRDENITKRGDCFVGVKSDFDFSGVLDKIKNAKRLVLELECEGMKETVVGESHPGITLSDSDIVVRKSGYVDSRTLMINADRAACDFDREFVGKLRRGEKINCILYISPP
jgi:hypothetical protein